jgi:hypothetical protein
MSRSRRARPSTGTPISFVRIHSFPSIETYLPGRQVVERGILWRRIVDPMGIAPIS